MGGGQAFEGTNIYTDDDIPEIDYLLITHDHWDHLDYSTVQALEPKIKKVICGLGVGTYFKKWGYSAGKIKEADWNTKLEEASDFVINVLSARHYSGRLLSKNKTLWVSYALESPDHRIFLSGDSGYGPHFAEIGNKFNGFDLAILDAGQYDKRWANIHMNPEEAIRAAEDLKAKELLPGHIGRFAIAKHAWDEPFKRISAAGQNDHYRLLTPIIGEPVRLMDKSQKFSQWWDDSDARLSSVKRDNQSTQPNGQNMNTAKFN